METNRIPRIGVIVKKGGSNSGKVNLGKRTSSKAKNNQNNELDDKVFADVKRHNKFVEKLMTLAD